MAPQPTTAEAPFDLAEVDRLLTTTKAVRRRLDLARPVPRAVLLECLELATHTPNASNSQEWHWVVLDDREQIRRVGDLYRTILRPRSLTMLEAKERAGDDAGARVTRSVLHLADHMGEVPAIVVACYDVPAALDRYGRLLDSPDGPQAMDGGMYASILPAVWSFQLALRSRGLGSTLTTAHQLDEPALAEILGIPAAWAQVALLPVAYTTGGGFSPAPRRKVDETVIWNHGGLR